jgi:hypothetical protein
MNFVNLGYDAAHAYVNKTPGAFWDGWEVVIWKSNPRAYKRTDGMFRNGRWGTARRFSVTTSGKWRLPIKP